MAKRIVIIGAGYAGISTALTLHKKKKKEDLEILLIDKNNYHTLLTELHEVAANRIGEEGIIVPLKRIFDGTSVQVVQDEITEFDFANKSVRSENNQYPYDYLVMGMGSEPNCYNIPGLDEHAFTLWSYEDALRIRSHVRHCFEKAARISNPDEKKRLLTFIVVGAGFTGVEMAGELHYYAKDLAREYGFDLKKDVCICLTDLMDHVLPQFDDDLANKAQRKMEKLGIALRLGANVCGITETTMTTNTDVIPTETVIWAAGIRAHRAVEEFESIEKIQGRRLAVNEFCRTAHSNVYAVGDITGYIDDENGKPYPAMVENALQTGTGVALNILRDIKNQPQEKVKVKMHGAMVCVGPFFAVADLSGIKPPSWLAIIMKYLVNAHYLWEIMGLSGVSNYFYHELVFKRQRRHLLEKHWSTRTQAFWLVPLRLFTGIWWVYEGITKVMEGWLSSPHLAAFMGVGTDAVSGATSAAYVNRIDDIFRINIGVIDWAVNWETRMVSGETIFKQMFSTLGIFHFGDFELMDWIVRNLVLANDGTSMFFQVLIVLAEILVGLLLIAGLFNFPASIASLGLVILFWTSTGIYQNSWWMVFASIALMGGAGRAFGLDYYALPYLSNLWDHARKNGKLRLAFKNAFKRWNDEHHS